MVVLLRWIRPILATDRRKGLVEDEEEDGDEDDVGWCVFDRESDAAVAGGSAYA